MKKLYSLLSVVIVAMIMPVNSICAVPANYYNSINGLADRDLKNALHKLIYNHTEVKSYNALPEYFRTTDNFPGTDYWWDMYSDMEVSMYITFGTYMNREHCFPKSWWGGSTSTPAYVDLFHLYPSEAAANQAKSNYPLGEVVTSTFDNGVVKVGYAKTGQGGGSSKVFEPNEQYIGDFARTYFYVVTCYQNLTWASKNMYMLEQNTYPTLKPWAVDLLLKWHRADPVSQKEVDRNEAVYGFQGNRNPFIDHPELVEYIWGNKVGQKYTVGGSQPVGDPELTTPVQDMALDFEQIAIGKSETRQLAFLGHNLTGRLELVITGADKSMFSLDTKTIESSLVNADGGYFLPVTYKPTSLGVHSAKLIISVGDIPGSRGVALMGECLAVPTLTAPVATAASDITDDSYIANWEVPSEVVDYYIVTRTRYINGNSSSEEIMAEENSLLIDDFSSSTSESYNVRSVRLGYESPVSNEIFVYHAGVDGVEMDSPLGYAYWPGGLRIVCGDIQHNLEVYDIAGRRVMTIAEVANNDIIELPFGVYFIATDECRTPLRVIVK
ncbi:MAG: endonuclease [Muribaculaceae bacterium]|nr:endonuclease [Muribaculaceae bacterium]